jgi:hypothetical protein
MLRSGGDGHASGRQAQTAGAGASGVWRADDGQDSAEFESGVRDRVAGGFDAGGLRGASVEAVRIRAGDPHPNVISLSVRSAGQVNVSISSSVSSMMPFRAGNFL